jgi:NADPH-dependent 2,4-dienoyl-CoA reductase/sulfur reductase-like enzyme
LAQVDLIIIGAGPAGMAAARQAADCGLSVALLDEQPRPGGQIYRAVESSAGPLGNILGVDYTKGLALVEGVAHQRIQLIDSATVWKIENGDRVIYSRAGAAASVTGRRILIATGALERPMPIPGWTVPGVMTAGAAQILLKQSGMIFDDAVLVGSGPLLYLIAVQMCRAGRPPKALVETQRPSDLAAAMRHLPGALRGWRYLAKGLGLIAELRRARVKRYTGATGLAVVGEAHAEALTFKIGARTVELESRSILLHHGVVPNVQISRALKIPHRWDRAQHAFVPEIDEWGQTALPTIYIAGDGGGIGGAEAAAVSGALSALSIACDLERVSSQERDARAEHYLRKRRSELAARPFIDRAYPPHPEALAPSDSTVICRCEEVTAGEVRRYAELGCIGPNQTKAFGRVGMGPCQGRYCGLTVTELLAAATGRDHEAVGYYKLRSPYKPVTLGEVSALNDITDTHNPRRERHD